MSRFWKLLALVAVLLLPLGMSGPAMAAAPDQHRAMAGMPMTHCPDAPSKSETKPGIAACTMICAAALPAFDQPRPESPSLAVPPLQRAPIMPLAGVQPEAATPPPRIA